MNDVQSARRSMLSGVGAALAAIAFGSKRAAAQAPGDAFQPARHQQDEWMTRLPGKHRTIIDCATVSGAGEGMLYASNLYLGNKNGYQLNESDVAVIVCLRHRATAFAYNDAIWAKYDVSTIMGIKSPSGQPYKVNPYITPQNGELFAGPNSTPAAVQALGTRIILCNNAFGFWTMILGRATNQEPAAVRAEMLPHLAQGVTIVPAMVQAVEQAQRAGLTYMKNS